MGSPMKPSLAAAAMGNAITVAEPAGTLAHSFMAVSTASVHWVLRDSE